MKKILFYTFLLLYSAGILTGCTKDNNYPGGELSSVIAVSDIRSIYKGTDITLDTKNMFGAHQMVGIVVSDPTGGNMPSGLLVVQNYRRAKLRGISIPLGTDAAKYAPGDSVVIDIAGGVLKRVDGTLQITGISNSAITKVASGKAVIGQRVTSSAILTNPDAYESTLVAIVKGGFDPLPAPTDKLAGDRVVNDGFGNIGLHTEANAAFATNTLPISANFTGIIFGTSAKDGSVMPQLRMRKADDVKVLSSVIEITPVVITGFLADPGGSASTDANYEYIQLLATRDIDFSVEKFTIVTTNNASASTPAGFPVKGWATGDLRTYKLEITSGKVTKGSYFYVGGTNKKINGVGSTDISASNWVKAFNYSTTNSPNFSTAVPATFGTKTSNLLANSGNAAGIAVFSGTNITDTSKPVDVIFYGTGGSLYDATTSVGYRIANTDFYDLKDLITLADQPFNRQGSNTLAFPYSTAGAYFAQFGGVYNASLGKWTSARVLLNIPLTTASVITDIENDGSTKLK
ncbi:DUF5689 domain-containing protein [Mucilaginibacter aquaedulcis]|uniref:DUF5689 domain-containing protein n=1 Tax=Mucilaginibacter aquaedulcis TaxID=1187081 RepID=UPI0025B4FFC5|nr:DUF5689 domain-containing protein [Mucilaginibacter aquaedulcis]MDN3547686.1 DUF5689 domain-containing protein [Mucilaginibacter aquaedulcis]